MDYDLSTVVKKFKQRPMAFKFESLLIWQKAFDLTDEVHNQAVTFSKNKMFGLASQIKRAGDSVVLNIAEGSTGL